MSPLRRLLPTPLLSVMLVGFWLLLNQSLSPGHWLLGVVLGVLAPLLTESLRPRHARVAHPWVALKLLGYFLLDMARSNFDAARLILASPSSLRSGFLRVPLNLSDPHALVLLAIFVNASPGTVWARVSEDRRELTLHVLDLSKADQIVQTVVERYEKPLRLIFESRMTRETES